MAPEVAIAADVSPEISKLAIEDDLDGAQPSMAVGRASWKPG